MNNYGGSALLNIKPSQSALLTALPQGEPFHAAIGCHRNYSLFIIQYSLFFCKAQKNVPFIKPYLTLSRRREMDAKQRN